MGGWWNKIFIITIIFSCLTLLFSISESYGCTFGLKDLFALHKLENILTHVGQIKILPRVHIFHKT